ncbi:MAG: hypothetical protein Q8R91_08655 [Candidatus Omnitrophota bacterium]|nr:hypothetical protein [Candidatus Omnitrophota bacterium]
MDQETPIQTTLNVTTVSRPKRIAFLVNPLATTDDELNQLIRYSVGLWGGRFHVIIPTTGDTIEEDWWKLLTIVDPDIIYSLLPLTDPLVRKINKAILPVRIIEPTPKNRERGERQRYPIHSGEIGALETSDIIRFHHADPRKLSRRAFFYCIKDFWEDTVQRRFVLRNFGALPNVVGIADAFRDVPHEEIELQPKQVVLGENIHKLVLRRLASHENDPVCPIDLARLYVQRVYRPKWNDFARGFHFVLGDSPLDVIYAWNRAAVSELFNGRETLWVPAEFAQDEEFLKLASEWIRRAFWGRDHDQVGNVVSYSVEDQELSRVAKVMQEALGFHFRIARLASHQFPSPDMESRPWVEGRRTEQVPLLNGCGLAGSPRPSFLTNGHPQQGWMVDVEVRHRSGDYSRSIAHFTHLDWRLPKRSCAAPTLFGNQRGSRVVNGGVPSVAVQVEDEAFEVQIPSDEAMIFACLGRRYTNTSEEHQQPKPQFTEMRISDKGRYLQGLLRLFGDVASAGSWFEDPFWRTVFLRMAGRPGEYNQRRAEAIKERIETFFSKDTTPIEPKSPRIDQLAEELAQDPTVSDPEPEIMQRKGLRSIFNQLRSEALQKRPDDGYWKARDEFDEELEHLLNAKIMLQGAKVRCPHCFTTEWRVVDDLSSEMRCNGCLFRFSFPLAPEWSFQLNDLVGNALKKHGTLAVLHTLYKLNSSPHGPFLFVPCQDIFKRDQTRSFTDLDIVAIRNCRVIIGEVKSSPVGFKSSDFDKLRQVAEDLAPDEVLIAAPGEEWPSDVMAEIHRLRDALSSQEIEVEELLLDWSL